MCARALVCVCGGGYGRVFAYMFMCKCMHALVGFSMQIKYAMKGEKQNDIE